VTDGPEAGGTEAASSVEFPVNESNWATSGHSITIAPNPDGQSVMSVAGLLMSQLVVADDFTGKAMWAAGNIAAPAPAPNNATNSVTSTLNITPATSTGTAYLNIDLLWMIYRSNPGASWADAAFTVTIFRNQTRVLEARTNTLQGRVVTVFGDDTLGNNPVTVDPEGDGLGLATTINNVQNGDTFTITVNPYNGADTVAAGQTATVEIDLAIDAQVQVVQ
jgi:hypothetical protein